VYDYTRTASGRMAMKPRSYIHNCYLEIWLLYGLLGICSFLWLLGAFAWRCLYVYRHAQDDFTRAAGAAFFAAFMGVLIRSWLAMTFSRQSYSIIAFTGMWGTLETIWYLHQERHSRSTRSPRTDADTLQRI